MSHAHMVLFSTFALLLPFSVPKNATSAPQPSQIKVGWQAGPNQRGTLTLVWSCVATIVTCTWSILHLNVPHRDDSPWTKRLRKVKWMCITILFPEFVFAKAFCELQNAVDDTFEMKMMETETHWKGTKWKVEFAKSCRILFRVFHLFDSRKQLAMKSILSQNSEDVEKRETIQVNTDGSNDEVNAVTQSSPEFMSVPLVTQGSNIESATAANSPRINVQPAGGDTNADINMKSDVGQQEVLWTPVHTYFANMGGFDEDTQRHKWFGTAPITTETIRLRWKTAPNILISVPSRMDIEDKSKADLLIKLLAVSQITWLVLSVVVRGISHLPVSQLEIVTVAFSAIAVATYLCNLWKPKDVDIPIKLKFPQESLQAKSRVPILSRTISKRIAILEDKPHDAKSKVMSFSTILVSPAWETRFGEGSIAHKRRILNDTCRVQNEEVPMILIVAAASTLAFGCLHCIAWSFEFPSMAEVFIWRIASIATATLPGTAIFGSLLLALPVKPLLPAYEKSVRAAMQLLETYPPEYWKSFNSQSPLRSLFKERIHQASVPFSRLKAPTASFEELMKAPEEGDGECYTFLEPNSYDPYLDSLADVFSQLREILEAFNRGVITFYRVSAQIDYTAQFFSDYGSVMPSRLLEISDRELSWKLYEAFVRSKLGERGRGLPFPFFADYLAEVSDVNVLSLELDRVSGRCDNLSRILTSILGVLYSIARVALLVIAFTSLRSVPESLYIDSWTRFMANIS